MMRPTHALEVAVEFNNAITNRDLVRLGELMTEDHTLVTGTEDPVRGKEACLEAWRQFFELLPDYRNVFERVWSVGEVVRMCGCSESSDERLHGPAIWKAVVEGTRVREWHVDEDTPAGRRRLGQEVREEEIGWRPGDWPAPREDTPAMSSEENKEIVRRFYEEVFNQGRVDLIPDLVSEDYTEVMDGRRFEVGREGAEAHALGVRETYPDLELTIERQIAEGEWVVSCITASGTHAGEWMGIAPTGKKVTFTGVNVDRVVAGRIVEHGGAANMLGPLLEIGAIRVVGGGKATPGEA